MRIIVLVKVPMAFLIIVVVLGVEEAVAVGFTLSRRFRGNRFALSTSLRTLLPLLIAAVIDTTYADCAKHRGIGDLCYSLLGMAWVMVLLAIAMVDLVVTEVYFEKWTSRGEIITTYCQPKGADMAWLKGGKDYKVEEH